MAGEASDRAKANFVDLLRSQAQETLDLCQQAQSDPDVAEALLAILHRIGTAAQSLELEKMHRSAGLAARALARDGDAVAAIERVLHLSRLQDGGTLSLRPHLVVVAPAAQHAHLADELSRLTVTCHITEDAAAAALHVEQNHVDAVLLHPAALERWVRAPGAGPGPLVFCYGPDEALQQRVRAARLGAAAYLTAPLDVKEALALVRQRLACTSRGPHRVLLVHQDRADASELVAILGTEDVHIRTAHEVSELTRAAHGPLPDLILVASGLRGVPASDVIAVLRTHSHFCDVPCALVVADSDAASRAQSSDAEEVFRRNDDDFALRRRLLLLLRRRRRDRELRATDGQTGLAHHSVLLANIERDIAIANRAGHPSALFRIEIDNPIHLRIKHGPAVLVLAQGLLARAVRETVRASDCVGRLSDNVVIGLLPFCSLADARARLTIMRTRFQALTSEHPELAAVAMCSGVADASCGGVEALGRADRDLLAAWGGDLTGLEGRPDLGSALPFLRRPPPPLLALVPTSEASPPDDEVVSVDIAAPPNDGSRRARLVQVGWSLRGTRTIGNHRNSDIVIPEARTYAEQAFLTLDYARLSVESDGTRVELLQEGEASVVVAGRSVQSADARQEATLMIIRRNNQLEPDFHVSVQLVRGAALPDRSARFLEVDVTVPPVAALFTLELEQGYGRAVTLGAAKATIFLDGERAWITDIVCDTDEQGRRPIHVRLGARAWCPSATPGESIVLEPGDTLLVGHNVYRFFGA